MNYPRKFFKEKKGSDWVATSWEWCGAQLSSYLLKNGESIEFQLTTWGKKEFQIYTVFSDAKDFKIRSLVKLYEKTESANKSIQQTKSTGLSACGSGR